MNVKVRYFAVLREVACSDGELLTLPSGSTIDGLRRVIESRRPEAAAVLDDARFAVNEEFVAESFELSDGDTVAVIPPVSGG